MASAPDVRPHYRAERQHHLPDQAIAVLAARQHGVVGRDQLAALGLGRRAIGHRLETGRLHPLHRGVYAVGHRVVGGSGRWMAAVLAFGPDAALSHRSAAALHGIRISEGAIDVTVAKQRRPRAGIRMHLAALAEDERTSVNGIPTTTVARTLLDLAATLSRHRLEKAINEAERLRLGDSVSLTELVQRHPCRKGTPVLRGILADARLGEDITRSELEDRFLELIDRAGLKPPRTNTRIEGFEVDAAWPDERLIVELDGHAFHRTRDQRERDLYRDRKLQAKGWRVIRITWRELHYDPAGIIGDLRTLLGR